MFRLQIKFGKSWKYSLHSYPTQEAAIARVEELISMGQKRNKIRVISEKELFN